MPARTPVPVALLVVALIVVTGGCLLHADDGAPDLCSSLVAVAVGLMLTLSLGPPRQIVFARVDGYRTASFDPPAPPPKA